MFSSQKSGGQPRGRRRPDQFTSELWTELNSLAGRCMPGAAGEGSGGSLQLEYCNLTEREGGFPSI